MSKLLIRSEEDIHNIDCTDKEFLVSVEGVKNLYVRFRENGTKEFMYIYTAEDKKRKKLSFGSIKRLDLVFAKAEALACEKSLKRGQCPSELKKQGRLVINPTPFLHEKKVKLVTDEGEITLHQAYHNWIAMKMEGGRIYSTSTFYRWRVTMNPILDIFGNYGLDSIKQHDLYPFFQEWAKKTPVLARGGVDYLHAIFKYAKMQGYFIGENPCNGLKSFLFKKKTSHTAAIIDRDEFLAMMGVINAYEGVHRLSTLALKLLPHLFPRIGDYCNMQWSDIDQKNKRWEFVPQKQSQFINEEAETFIIPLSEQAMLLLEELHDLNPTSRYVFSSIYDVESPTINDDTLNKVLYRLGYKNKQSPHGFRASARSLLQEELDFSSELAELQLGHTIPRTHDGAYDRTKFIKQRTQMMGIWSDFLKSSK